MDFINNYSFLAQLSERIIVETLLNLGKRCKKYQLPNVDPGFPARQNPPSRLYLIL